METTPGAASASILTFDLPVSLQKEKSMTVKLLPLQQSKQMNTPTLSPCQLPIPNTSRTIHPSPPLPTSCPGMQDSAEQHREDLNVLNASTRSRLHLHSVLQRKQEQAQIPRLPLFLLCRLVSPFCHFHAPSLPSLSSHTLSLQPATLASTGFWDSVLGFPLTTEHP